MVNKIRELAEKKGLTIHKIEKEAGLGHGAIGKWEKSKPIAENLQRVAHVLGVSIETLLSDE